MCADARASGAAPARPAEPAIPRASRASARPPRMSRASAGAEPRTSSSLLGECAAMLGCPEDFHRRADVRQEMRLGDRTLDHEILVAADRNACPHVITEVDHFTERAGEPAARVRVDCMPRRADLHPLRTERNADGAALRDRLDERAFDAAVAGGHTDRAATVGGGFHVPGEPVVLADEARHERVARMLVDALRRVELLDTTAMEHRDAV